MFTIEVANPTIEASINCKLKAVGLKDSHFKLFSLISNFLLVRVFFKIIINLPAWNSSPLLSLNQLSCKFITQ